MRPARTGRVAAGGAGARYSRLEAEVSAMQRNSGTYCDEPEDGRDYAAWLAGFDLAARRGEIEAITSGNAFMAELQARIVPLIVQYDVFWTRYFYQCAPPQPPPQRPCPSPFVRTQKGCVPGLCCKARHALLLPVRGAPAPAPAPPCVSCARQGCVPGLGPRGLRSCRRARQHGGAVAARPFIIRVCPCRCPRTAWEPACFSGCLGTAG